MLRDAAGPSQTHVDDVLSKVYLKYIVPKSVRLTNKFTPDVFLHWICRLPYSRRLFSANYR